MGCSLGFRHCGSLLLAVAGSHEAALPEGDLQFYRLQCGGVQGSGQAWMGGGIGKTGGRGMVGMVESWRSPKIKKVVETLSPVHLVALWGGVVFLANAEWGR